MTLGEEIKARAGERLTLHEQYLNPQMVKVLKTIGFERSYVRAQGPYLYDDQDQQYLDLLSGFGVFALGRNHPRVIEALREVLDSGWPDMVQMDVSPLAGLLAERLQRILPPGLERLFFANSGTETVEAAIKFSRMATGRKKLVACHNAFHGLTMGSLSLTEDENFRSGFEPFLPDVSHVPFNDLAALEETLAGNDVAAFIVEPIQGHGVFIPDDDYLNEAAQLCRRHGTLFIADEVQTGLGRTGRYFAVEHWGVEPDILCTAKALSGGFVPIGAVAMRGWIFDKVFNRMDRAVVHGSTFSKNNMAMAAGIATLDVIAEEQLVEHAARMGGRLVSELQALVPQYEFLQGVRGRGLMLALEFAEPQSFKLRTSWRLLESASKGLFSQMITVPLFTRHRVLSQVAAHGMNVVKFIPPLVISEDDCRWIHNAVDEVISDAHRVPGAVWDFGKQLARQAFKNKSSAA